MSASFEQHQLDQILSLLNDQRECITIRSIMLELTVNRGVARSILEEVVKSSQQSDEASKKYHVVRMVSRNGGRMELVADQNGEEEEKAAGRPFSIALVIPPDNDEDAMDEDEVDENGNPIDKDGENAGSILSQLAAAHEKALATQRDKLVDGNTGELFEILRDLSIRPAPELCGENDEEGSTTVRRVERSQIHAVAAAASAGGSAKGGKSKFGKASSTAAASSSTISSSKAKKGKPTTAAAFFGAHIAASKKKSKKTTETKPPSQEEVASPGDKENNANKKLTSDKSSSKPSKKQKVKEEVEETPEENAGNADDFVGDVDEDEDFLEEEKARKARVAKAARKQARDLMTDEATKKRNKAGLEGRRSNLDPEKRRKREEQAENEKGNGSDEEENEYDDVMEVDSSKSKKKKKKEVVKSGAMDAFAKKKDAAVDVASSASGGAKKRRKRLVEQTSVDKNGYMCTETVTIWEDVSEAEEEEPPSKTASKAAPTAKSSASSSKGVGKSSKSMGKAKAGGAAGGKKKQAGLMGFFAKKKDASGPGVRNILTLVELN
eukprot:CAMPEP_0183729946 /NCGR_PEP_ID=MMETSP0737-20130205/31584_1 /TAXON_ID=385413 /ORGANISM="Thalassiosira miniscula, Strain CCMP1093" /LENGTH=551 /DNA_ID=CAMNT_0025962275 /DNA_START=36 /DNA_END=1692 /DNA_ORIENTATION=-